MTDPNKLKALSERATAGPWRVLEYDTSVYITSDAMNVHIAWIIDEVGQLPETIDRWKADFKLAATLVNAYRSGSLIPAQPTPEQGSWRTDMENAPRDGELFLAWWPWCDYGDGVMEAHFDRAWFDPNGNLKTLGDCFGNPTPYSPTHWREVYPPAALNKGEG